MSDELIFPNDLAACHAIIRQMAQTIDEQASENKSLQQKNDEQKLTINELMQRMFRQRSERYLEDPRQLKLDLGDTAEAEDAANGLADAIEQAEIIINEHARRKRANKKPRNEQLPAHLERRQKTLEVADEVKHCSTHGERVLIGYDIQETLQFEPPQLWVLELRIPKFACQDQPQCGIVEPNRPAGLVEGNRYGTSVAAEIITGKYGYHLPIYRQQDWFAGSGWTPSRSTLLNIQSAAAQLIKTYVEYLRSQVLASEIIGTDETRVTLLLPPEIPEARDDRKSQRIHEVFSEARAEGKPSVSARMWAYRSMLVPLNIFDFTVSRHRDGPDEFLVNGNFTGKLMADCYSGYQGITLRSDSRIERGACNAHARRKIFEGRENYSLLSAQFLAMYQQLYDIETRACEMTTEQRQALRDTEARPIWARMRDLLSSEAAINVLPKDKFAEALNYLRNQWDALQLYLSDGRLPIDNNDTEQLMKQIAIGRKNWLFIGSVAAGERAADLMTLVGSAVRNDLDVWAYIKDVLDQLLAGSTDYESLRPDVWGQKHPEMIRQYRREERRDRADAKRVRRARRRIERSRKP